MPTIDEAMLGQMFSVPWSPNPHCLEFIRPRHCSLHGDFIRMEAGLRKRRNSETRPWGNVYIVDVDDQRIAAISEEIQ